MGVSAPCQTAEPHGRLGTRVLLRPTATRQGKRDQSLVPFPYKDLKQLG